MSVPKEHNILEVVFDASKAIPSVLSAGTANITTACSTTIAGLQSGTESAIQEEIPELEVVKNDNKLHADLVWALSRLFGGAE